MYLFLVALGLCCCAWALCSCCLQTLGHVGSVLWHIGFVTPRQVEYSQIRDGTCVHCSGRRIPNPWTTRTVPRVLKDILWIICYLTTCTEVVLKRFSGPEMSPKYFPQ